MHTQIQSCPVQTCFLAHNHRHRLPSPVAVHPAWLAGSRRSASPDRDTLMQANLLHFKRASGLMSLPIRQRRTCWPTIGRLPLSTPSILSRWLRSLEHIQTEIHNLGSQSRLAWPRRMRQGSSNMHVSRSRDFRRPQWAALRGGVSTQVACRAASRVSLLNMTSPRTITHRRALLAAAKVCTPVSYPGFAGRPGPLSICLGRLINRC